MRISPVLSELIQALRILPGIGQKTATKIALSLLERNRDGAKKLSLALMNAVDKVGYCTRCRALSETDLCNICNDLKRDDSLLCIVQSPLDIYAFEASGFNGLYFVLRGNLSPLDGIGPEDIGIDLLLKRVAQANVGEIIFALHANIEAETTIYYVVNLLNDKDIVISKLAHGVPLGAEIDNIDGTTLQYALQGRTSINA